MFPFPCFPTIFQVPFRDCHIPSLPPPKFLYCPHSNIYLPPIFPLSCFTLPLYTPYTLSHILGIATFLRSPAPGFSTTIDHPISCMTLHIGYIPLLSFGLPAIFCLPHSNAPPFPCSFYHSSAHHSSTSPAHHQITDTYLASAAPITTDHPLPTLSPPSITIHQPSRHAPITTPSDHH